MSDRDTITLPREVVQEALEALEFAERNHDGEQSLYTQEITALRTALAAEQPKPEPVAWFLPQPLEVHYYSAKNQALQREVEALRRDAERYRWLRDKAPPDIGDMASVRDSHDPFEIDAAIDAAMENKR